MPTKVKFVEYGEQAKVKIVDYGENLQVVPVEYGEQMRVKIVEYGEDLKIKIVKNSGSGPCLIATACVKAQGLPDDSPELNAARSFRDTFVRSLPDGEEIVRLYYQLAPQIISWINTSEDAQQVYLYLYEHLTSNVELIRLGKYHEALSNAFKLADELKRQLGKPNEALSAALNVVDELRTKYV